MIASSDARLLLLMLICQSSSDLHDDGAGTNLLEDGDGFAVAQTVKNGPVHGQDLVTC